MNSPVESRLPMQAAVASLRVVATALVEMEDTLSTAADQLRLLQQEVAAHQGARIPEAVEVLETAEAVLRAAEMDLQEIIIAATVTTQGTQIPAIQDEGGAITAQEIKDNDNAIDE